MKFRLQALAALFAIHLASPPNAALNYYVAPEDAPAKLARILVNGGQFLVYVDGIIEPGDADRFVSFISSKNITAARVIFNSPGGSLLESLRIGKAIRAKKFDTDVGVKEPGKTSICASACTYAFAGGLYRYFESNLDKFGLHQFSSPSGPTGPIGDTQLLSGALVEYLESMGVDGRAFSVAATASPDDIVWITPSRARSLRLTNGGELPTTAEIKTIDMTPYLKVEQVRRNSDVRILFLCGTKGVVIQAGIVSTPDESGMNAEISKRSYIEFDGNETLVEGAGAAKAEGSVLWLVRGMTVGTAMQFGRATEMGVWTEGGGAFRWGGYLKLSGVHEQINKYLDDCRAYGLKRRGQ